MANSIEKMSPDASPGKLNKTGVRRVNNLPLFIVIGALTLFVFIIAMVAVKRSEAQNTVQESIKVSRNANNDSSMMAAEIVAGHASGIIPPTKHDVPTDTAIAMPVAMLDNPDAPPVLRQPEIQETLDDPELSRIRMAKLQQFEDAVKAKTSIELPNQLPTQVETNSSNDIAARIASVKREIEQVGDPTATYQMRLQQIRASMQGANGGSIDSLASESQNPSLVEGLGDRWALNSKVEAPRTPYELRAGAVVPGIMISGIKSGLPGQIIGQVSQNVYDTATGKHLLIPQGTRLIGVYSNNVAYGQDTVLIAWQRLIFPDSKALDIGSMPGADSAGFTGFHDEVNNHYVRIFGSALLMSGVTAGITYSQGQSSGGPYSQPTAGSVMSEALGQQLGQVTAQMIEKNLNIAPSLTIRPGYRFNIIVVKDMTFKKPYQSFDY